MGEYISPKYAAVVRELRTAQQEARRDGKPAPVRGFLIPRPTGGQRKP